MVKFSEGIEQCVDSDIFIEISPHNVLSSSIKNIFPKKLILQSGNRKENSAKRFLSSLAKLYFCSADVKMNKFGIENNKFIHKYLFNRTTFYKQPQCIIDRFNSNLQKFNTIKFSSYKYPYLRDHIIGNKPILPTVCYIDLIKKYYLEESNTIENFNIYSMYEIKDDIEFDIDKNKNYYSFYYNKNKFISFNIANTKNEVFNLDTNILNVGKRLDENQLINILKNKNFNFGNNMFNFKKAIVNNN